MLGQLVIDLNLNLANFVSGIGKVETGLNKMQKSVNMISGASFVYLARQVLSAAESIYSFSRGIASAANDIERNAKVLNMSISSYQQWTYAAKMADVSNEDMMNGFKFLTRSISEAQQGTGDAAKAFDILKIKLTDTSGKTKDQQNVMLETIGALNKFADGANRDALMLAIFGRSWMTLKPLVNEGTGAIKASMEEFVKMGGVLGDVVVKKGSEAETQFKKLGTQINTTKLSLAPAALAVANFANELVKLFTMEPPPWVKVLWGLTPMGLPGAWQTLGQKIGMVPETFKGSATSFWTSPYGEHKPMPGATKPAAPALPGKYAGAESKDVLSAWDAIVQKNEELWEIYKGQNETIYLSLDTIKGMDTAFAMVLADAQKLSDSGKMPSWEDAATEIKSEFIPNIIELDQNFAMVVANAQKLSDLGEMPSWLDTLEELPKGFAKIGDEIKSLDEWAKNIEGMKSVFVSVGNTITESWVNNFRSMLDGTISFSEGVKNIFKDLSNEIISSITRMIANWILWNNVQGAAGYKAGGTGWAGILGSIAGAIFSGGSTTVTAPVISGIFGKGGITGPLLAHYPIKNYAQGGIASSPQIGIFGEGKGQEAFVPLQGGAIPVQLSGSKEEGPKTTNFLIFAMDPISFRDFIKRNPEAIVEAVHKDTRSRGTLRSDMRRYGG